MARSAEAVLDRVSQLHQTLATEDNLEPRPEIDAVFSALVELVRHRPGERLEHILADPVLRAIQPSLHRLCALGEYFLELHWSTRVSAAADSTEELTVFPYYDNYQQLSRLEYFTVTALSAQPIRRIVFIGSGPLPLTSIVLAQQFGVRSLNIDICPQACALGERLVRRLGLPMVEFRCADVLDVAEVGPADVVVLAALVGLSRPEKRKVVRHLHRTMPDQGLLLVRSAEGLRTLLYPKLDVHDLYGFQPLTVTHPLNDVVNSLIVARNDRPAR